METMTQVQEKKQVKVAVKERESSVDLLMLQLVQRVKDMENAFLDVARLLHELHGLGLTDQAISERLKKAGVNMERSTVTMYRNIWGYFVADLGLPEDIKGIPINTLQTLRKYAMQAQLQPSEVKRLLDGVRDKSVSEAKAYLREVFEDTNDSAGEFATIKVPRPVYNILETAVNKISAAFQVLGYEETSEAQAIEFMAKLVADSDVDTLAELVARELGEVAE